jgi:hypothetical protein
VPSGPADGPNRRGCQPDGRARATIVLLVEAGVDAIPVTPDSFFAVKKDVADAEANLVRGS